MNLKLQEKLLELHESREYSILISTMYVDSPVKVIYYDEEENIVYDSEVFSGRKLSEVAYYAVSVTQYKNDWENIEL